MTWTSRDRIEASFLHKEPDRTPVFEYLLIGPRAEDVLGRAFPDYTYDRGKWIESAKGNGFEKTLKEYARNKIEIALKLGHDMLYICPNPLPDSIHSYDPLVGVDDYYVLDTISDPVDRLAVRNGKIAEEFERPLSDDCCMVYSFLYEEMDKHDLDLPIFAPAYFHGVWNDGDLMQSLILDPDEAHKHFSLATRRAKLIIDEYRKNSIKIIGIGGDFAGKVPLISPGAYREFIVPEVKKLAEYIRNSGGYSINATDGNIWSVIEDFLVGCGVDGYMEIDSGAGMDLGRLKKLFGDRTVLLGNMDCGNVLTFSTPEEIAEITHSILDEGYGNGGHVFTASNAITESIPLDNYFAMVNAYRDHFSLPPLRLDA